MPTLFILTSLLATTGMIPKFLQPRDVAGHNPITVCLVMRKSYTYFTRAKGGNLQIVAFSY